jgi:cytochrome c-type biogenesis protein CcmH
MVCRWSARGRSERVTGQRGDRPAGRRDFLRAGLALIAVPVARHAPPLAPAQDSLAGRGELGTLRDPTAVGRPRRPTDPEENAAEIQAIELRLACNCGCTLDVFTCRTTDFSCTYSPRLHREVLALRSQGLSAQQVIDAFVEQYGEQALMAPKPKGFNLAGYLVPGAAIATAGAALVLLISRRRAALAAPAAGATPTVEGSDEELARLQRALDEVED